MLRGDLHQSRIEWFIGASLAVSNLVSGYRDSGGRGERVAECLGEAEAVGGFSEQGQSPLEAVGGGVERTVGVVEVGGTRDGGT